MRDAALQRLDRQGFAGYPSWRGEMAEWSKAAVSKTVNPQGFGGSNPSLSAKIMH